MTDYKERILALRKTKCSAIIAGEDMFWSPQEKEDFLEEIDKEIDELYDGLQRTHKNTA